MISRTYGRMIRRYEGIASVELARQYQQAKVEAMYLLSAHSTGPVRGAKVGPRTDLWTQSWSRVGPQVGP
jgi:hypothetical protein